MNVREVGLLRFWFRWPLRQFCKRVLRRDNVLRLPGGNAMRLPRNSRFGTEAFVTQAAVDWGSEAIFASHLGASGTLLDVGANIGYYSMYCAPYCKQVFAFEPDPRNLDALRSNATAAVNVEVVTAAASSAAGEMTFSLGETSELSRLGGAAHGEVGRVRVEVVTLDEFMGARPELRVAGIKTDTEGHDLDVLRGAVNVVRKHQPLILSEVALDDEELYRFACDVGYAVFALTFPAGAKRFVMRRFRSLEEGKAAAPCKMVFLVPPTLREAFEARL